jgi:hypothetical protein
MNYQRVVICTQENDSYPDRKCDYDNVFFLFRDQQSVSYRIGASSLDLSRGEQPSPRPFFQV